MISLDVSEIAKVNNSPWTSVTWLLTRARAKDPSENMMLIQKRIKGFWYDRS